MRDLVRLAAGAALIIGLGGCDWMQKKEPPGTKTEKELAEERDERIRLACASDGTYDRLKELAFDEAARIRNGDARNLDALAASSVVRMEDPTVKSRDEDLNVTVCSGRFILELPPGAERAFNGERRLAAEVEYAAQAAIDGSGLVFNMEGAEPIVYRLAMFGMQGQGVQYVEVPQPSGVPGMPPQAVPEQAPQGAPQTAPQAAPAPRPEPRTVPSPPPKQDVREVRSSNPSFSCARARTRSERMVCSSPSLAAQDRAMSSLFYSSIAEADPATKRRIRNSRDAFLGRRERCSSEACVSAAYQQRIAEIRRMSAAD